MTSSAFASAFPLPKPGSDANQLATEWDFTHFLSYVALIWYCLIWFVIVVGYSWIRRTYAKPPPPSVVPDDSLPAVTILRPIKGCDPNLDICLASTCLLDYPRNKYELVFCVASPTDSSIPVIKSTLEQYPNVNAKLVISEEDVGPNPKIRNLSKAYREASSDIVWILDCNVWVPPGTLRRAVELLEGTNGRPGYKLVHHLPIAYDITSRQAHLSRPPSSAGVSSSPLLTKGSPVTEKSWMSRWISVGGGRFEENFLSSSHAKFYSAINTLRLGPCVVGKSELFRRSHLEEVTQDGSAFTGLDYFADYICEDHMISTKLWKIPLEEELTGKRKWGKHGMAPDIVFQPLSNMSIQDYTARRIRWISVRKYTELVASLTESLTESISMSMVGAYAATTLPFLSKHIGSSWCSFWTFWACSMFVWAAFDRHIYNFIHQYRSTVVDENSPPFIADRKGRTLLEWLFQWVGRESLASYVWVRSLIPGPITWRGGLYKIRWSDKKVVEIRNHSSSTSTPRSPIAPKIASGFTLNDKRSD
ncbi:nucleotide-diphospho-sugar transferase [Pyronema omphalodes]|nr:nucleotide-diphospho-sugar transferase [Pyronema omphalodes]